MTAPGDPQPLSVGALVTVPEAAEDDVDTPRQNVYRTPTRGPVPLSTDLPMDFDIPDCPNSPSPRRPSPDPFVVAAADDADGEPSSCADNTFAVGRTSSTTSTILDDAFQKMYNDLCEISGQVHMPLAQVIQRFTKQFARSVAWHPWNSYQRFWRAHKAQELARIKDVDVVHATPSMSPMQRIGYRTKRVNTAQQMTQCYKHFREEYPENWQEILATFDDADALNDEDKTVAQRQSLFHRLAKQQTQSVSTSMSRVP